MKRFLSKAIWAPLLLPYLCHALCLTFIFTLRNVSDASSAATLDNASTLSPAQIAFGEFLAGFCFSALTLGALLLVPAVTTLFACWLQQKITRSRQPLGRALLFAGVAGLSSAAIFYLPGHTSLRYALVAGGIISLICLVIARLAQPSGTATTRDAASAATEPQDAGAANSEKSPAALPPKRYLGKTFAALCTAAFALLAYVNPPNPAFAAEHIKTNDFYLDIPLDAKTELYRQEPLHPLRPDTAVCKFVKNENYQSLCGEKAWNGELETIGELAPACRQHFLHCLDTAQQILQETEQQ